MPPEFYTNRLNLRFAEETDVPEILRYLKANEAHFAPSSPPIVEGYYTEEFWLQYVQAAKDELANDQAIRFFAFQKENDSRLVATINFSQIFRGSFQACYLGFGIDQEMEGKGLIYEALFAAINFAFAERNLHRIMANHLVENKRSGNVLARLGFNLEGTAKDYLYINEAWRDHVLCSLTNPHWSW